MPNGSPAKIVLVRKLLFVVTIFVIGFAAFWLFVRPDSGESSFGQETQASCYTNYDLETITLSTDNKNISAEVASDGDDKVLGLSGRDCLNPDSGMLFAYELTGDYCFWMKDMNFPIDMIWLDDEKKVVTIESDVRPDSYPQTFCPTKPAQYILEVDTGYAEDVGWQIGTEFSW